METSAPCPDHEAPTGVPDRAAEQNSPLKLVAIVLIGCVAIYGATWLGPVFFYFLFQKQILAHVALPGMQSVLAGEVDEVDIAAPSVWELHDDAATGVRFRLPPGKIESVDTEGEAVVVEHESGSFVAQAMGAGFLGSILEPELAKMGVQIGEPRPDAEILQEIVLASPDDYRFAAPARERGTYAARLLAKMLLLEPMPARRMALATRAEPLARVFVIEYEENGARLFVADTEGMLILTFKERLPPSWGEAPGNWVR